MDGGTPAKGPAPAADDDLWIDEGSETSQTHSRGRRTGIVLAVAACVALIGVPVGLLAASGSAPAPQPSQPSHHVTMSHGPAKRSVLSALSATLSALSATTDSGNFDFSYQLTETSHHSTPTVVGPGPICSSASCPPGSVTWSTEVHGSGTINTNPMAMAASVDISSIGSNGLNRGGFGAGVRVDPTTVWLVANGDNKLTPSSDDGSGQDLPGFAGLVEGYLGSREGAVAMMGMASPTGYLDLVEPAVSSATEVGTATVDGVAVTQYQLSIDPGSLATAPGTSSEEQSTIRSALQKLAFEGFQAMRNVISIDASGFIRESASTVTFSDGGSVTLDAHFSNFRCAGTVLMPGQGGVSTAPSGCVSTDTAPTSTTTTTTTSALPPSPPGVVPPRLISIIPTSYGALVTWTPGSSREFGVVLSLCVDGHVSTAPTENFVTMGGTVVSEPPSPARLSAKVTTTLLDENLGTNWQSQWFEIYVYENGLPVWSQRCVGVGATAPSPPTTSVVHPASGTQLRGASASLVATASASNGLGIASVKFVLNRGFGHRVPICSAAPLFGYWWGHNCDTTGMADGTYTLQSYATDASGNSAYSLDVTITIHAGRLYWGQ